MIDHLATNELKLIAIGCGGCLRQLDESMNDLKETSGIFSQGYSRIHSEFIVDSKLIT
jgi:hypothetical protein